MFNVSTHHGTSTSRTDGRRDRRTTYTIAVTHFALCTTRGKNVETKLHGKHQEKWWEYLLLWLCYLVETVQFTPKSIQNVPIAHSEIFVLNNDFILRWCVLSCYNELQSYVGCHCSFGPTNALIWSSPVCMFIPCLAHPMVRQRFSFATSLILTLSENSRKTSEVVRTLINLMSEYHDEILFLNLATYDVISFKMPQNWTYMYWYVPKS